MNPRLALRTPQDPGSPVELPERGRMTIGSSSERADLVFASQGVAEIHCIVARTKDGGWAVQDMGSEFGTLLDGQRVEVARLRSGQTLLLGSVSLEVVDLEAPDTPTSAPEVTTSAPDPLLEQPAASTPPRTQEADTTGSTFLEIPGYSIKETIGRGGMGAVFLAKQDRLHRDVALKILSPRLAADTDFVRKFHREAQSAAAFNHPNVVTVYDVGEANGVHYLAMEYMDGESLEELLSREGRLPWKTVAQMLLGAARGLVYAESRGIVHRDIKPSNLMLNSEGQVKLADLGLAQRADDESADGRIFGTPHFMPPEQIRGETVDRRSDIYALGATGYRLLSGYTPFEGVSSREILRAVLTEDFDALRNHVSGVPSGFTSLIERMIARSPDDRPQSSESVVSHIEAVLAERSPPAAPTVTIKPKRSSKSGVTMLVVLALGAIGWYVWQELGKRQSDPETNIAQGPDRHPEEVTPIQDHDLGAGEQSPPRDPEDDDFIQKQFELEAENELLRLGSSSLTLSDRQAALLALAQKFDGTTAAARAREQADEVAEVLRMQNEEAATIASRREAVLFALRAAANLDAAPPRPGDSLRAMETVPNQDLLADDEPFQTQRKDLRAAVCARALEQARAQFDEAKSKLSDPDPTAVHDSLQDLVIRLQLPEFPSEHRPAGLEDLRLLAAEARDLLRNLDEHRQEFVTDRIQNDTVATAAACRDEDGLVKSLALLRPADGAARLEALATTLSTEEAKGTIAGLAEDFRAAAASLSALSSEFESWRRKTVTDPRPRRGNAEAVSIGPAGIEIQRDSSAELIDWSLFADQPEALHQLFHRRLARDWTEDEERGIAVLLRHAAVLNTLRVTREGLTDPSALKSRDIEKLLAAYAPASNWAQRTPQTDLLKQEVAAANALTQALTLAAGDQWGSAASTLTHAARTYPNTLLLLMTSDGSGAPTQEEDAPTSEDAPDPDQGLDPEGPAVPSPPDPPDPGGK